MDEATFKSFGDALDTLDLIEHHLTPTDRKIFREHFDGLDSLYYEIKEAYGYKDNSDKEE